MTRRGVNPCLICKAEAPGPKAGTVCQACVRKVSAYDELRSRSIAGTVTVRLPAYPSIPGSQRPFGEASLDGATQERDCNARGRLELLLRELRRALDKPASRWNQPLEGEGRLCEVTPRLSPAERATWRARDLNHELYNVSEEIAQFLVDLDPFLQLAFREAEADGKRQGSDLLASLAAGDLTTAEFERRAGISPAKE